MRGVICYYSATGNTRLACEAIVQRLSVPFDFVDMIEQRSVDLAPYDVVGVASSTDFWSAPRLVLDFIRGLPDQGGKPAFVFNTFGGFSGRTLLAMRDEVSARGFDVLAGHSLHMPESYPPMIAVGLGSAGAPADSRLRRFDAFVSALDDQLHELRSGREPRREPVRIGLVDGILPAPPRTTARRMMGEKRVDAALCTECGRCARRCPYGAIELAPKPVFDEARCFGCWRCVNRCPRRAIGTGTFRGGSRYPGPSDAVKRKLGA